MLTVQAGAPFEAGASAFPSGLVGTIGVRVVDNDGNTTIARTTAGIVEYPAGSGFYQVNLVAPDGEGQYSVVWDTGVVSPSTTAAEDLLVVSAEEAASLPGIGPEGAGPAPGPCSAWTTADEIVECCTDAASAADELLDELAAEASRILFALSGRQFAGECSRTLRPIVGDDCACWGGEEVERWWHEGGWWTTWNGGPRYPCCGAVQVIELTGYPVREITEVKIDGSVVPPDEYRLERHRFLRRLTDPGPPVAKRRWPACQDAGLADTESGTFVVRYLWGQDPPVLAQRAAAELACQLYLACPGVGGECALPEGTVSVTRQGISIERDVIAKALKEGGGLGLTQTDMFLATYNPHRLTRRPAVWSPDLPRHVPTPVEGT